MFRNPTTDILVVLAIVLLFFGPKRLPGLGRSLGSGIREFKDSITGGHGDGDDEQAEHPALSPAAGESAPAGAHGTESQRGEPRPAAAADPEHR